MKLSLRELFLLVALVAMGCGWWVDRQRQADEAKHWRAMVRTQDNERWHFAVAAALLEHKTGDIVTVEESGVLVKSADGTALYGRPESPP